MFVFSKYAAVTVPSFDPLVGVNVIQSASSAVVQLLFDVIVNVALPSVYPTYWSDGVTASDGVDSCVTVTVLVIPSPVIVIEPTL